MKFNIAYLGPEALFHLRRDFILSMKFSLEDLGHHVILSGSSLESGYINLIIGSYFLPKSHIEKITNSEIKYINVNTEVISHDMLNHNPQKVDMMGAYLPMIRNGMLAWDVIADNEAEYIRYEVKNKFLRWGYHPKLCDIEHHKNKDLDFYFFGMISPRRKAIIENLLAEGFRGIADSSCPYFLRNDRIARAKVQLNLIQDDKYTHVNSFRICYLANNACHIISEKENDPAGYLNYAEIADFENISTVLKSSLIGDAWRHKGEQAKTEFEKITMRSVMERLLEESFSER